MTPTIGKIALPRPTPNLDSLPIPDALKAAVRRLYQLLYDLRDAVVNLKPEEGPAACGSCQILVNGEGVSYDYIIQVNAVLQINGAQIWP